MKNIHVDGGALSENPENRFGNFTVTQELLRELTIIDSKNRYTVLTIETVRLPHFAEIGRSTRNDMVYKKLSPKIGWMKLRVSLEELTHPSDVFLGLNQSLPLYTKGKKIALCHGLSFLKYSELYPGSFRRMKKEIEDINRRADNIIVSSTRVKQEWKELVGNTKKIVVIPFGIPNEFLKLKSSQKRKPFLLFVGMNHPIKNLPFLIKTVSELRKIEGYQKFTLTLIGVTHFSDKPRYVKCISHASHKKLLALYRSTSCLVSASLYESFNLPILEALSQNTPVVSTSCATIPELKKYVTIAKPNVSDFVKKVVDVIREPPVVDQKQLREEFSWEDYAITLSSLLNK